ncbi:monovalent cation:H+ antiporter, CPA1 (nhx1) [Basidiobolus ranarum]|uniref:Sodium/hydrogen exchanger n=1 Tax=Basidiobolus ranarum TaxID=34480 RepID=A0ABR2W8A6_9FUNG
MKLYKVHFLHESVVSIFVGMFVGFIIRISPDSNVQNLMTFDSAFFLNLILPPIILNSGYELKRYRFFRHIGTILVFALLGTFTTALVIGAFTYIITLIGPEVVNLTLNECFMFGSVLSSTDPVTVLAIFSQLKVDPKLYSIIFGESILNDAVSIVLYETLRKYHDSDLHLSNVILGIGTFIVSFSSSMVIGVVVGMACALMLKHSQLHRFPEIESALVTIMAYGSYFLANALEVSGIVSLLFTGIAMKHYAYDNMSVRCQRSTKYMFHILCKLAENFIFIYLGVTMFTNVDDIYQPFFIVAIVIVMCIARYCAIFGYSKLINLGSKHFFKRPGEAIIEKHQFVLFWAGLRGAVSFVLAIGMMDYGGAVVRTTTLMVVVVSVIVFGGSTPYMLNRLDIATGVEDSDDESSENETRLPSNHVVKRDNRKKRPVSQRQKDSSTVWIEEEALLSEEKPHILTSASRYDNHWFTSFDNRHLKPFLTNIKGGARTD